MPDVLTRRQVQGKAWIMAINKLNDRAITNLKPEAKETKHFDGGGLYIAVKPNGKKVWRMAYRFQGVVRTYSMGEYPIVTLKEPREKRNAAKIQIESGIDPSKQKKAAKESVSGKNSFQLSQTSGNAFYSRKIKSRRNC